RVRRSRYPGRPAPTSLSFRYAESPTIDKWTASQRQTLLIPEKTEPAPIHLLLFPFRVLLLHETANCLIHVTKK
ncbi:hypothetical protein QOL70_07660, partial [Klebsiella quasipneumoniae]